MTRDARLSALHRGGFWLRGRASLTGICAGSVTASSSHPGRNAWMATSPASPGDRFRGSAAGRHASLRIQDRLENTPSMSESGQFLAQPRYVVKQYIQNVVYGLMQLAAARSRRPRTAEDARERRIDASETPLES